MLNVETSWCDGLEGSSCFDMRVLLCSTLTLRFDLRGSSLISTLLFKVLNLLKEEEAREESGWWLN